MEPDYSIGSRTLPGAAKLIEEMGELTQVIGKILAMGGKSTHWDGSNLHERLREEIGDVMASLEFFIKYNFDGSGQAAIKHRQSKKMDLLEGWHGKRLAPSKGCNRHSDCRLKPFGEECCHIQGCEDCFGP